jgi:hypothetical protein
LKAAKDGLNYYCKPCQRAANKACWAPYYKKNRKRLLKRQKDIQKIRRAEIAELKAKPCADCHHTFPPYVMDFDHLENKDFLLSRSGNRQWKKVLEEAEKCEVVCANCHRERTHRRSL